MKRLSYLVCGYGTTKNFKLLASVPPGVTTSTLPVVAPAGTVVVTSELDTTVNVAGVPLNVTLDRGDISIVVRQYVLLLLDMKRPRTLTCKFFDEDLRGLGYASRRSTSPRKRLSFSLRTFALKVNVA